MPVSSVCKAVPPRAARADAALVRVSRAESPVAAAAAGLSKAEVGKQLLVPEVLLGERPLGRVHPLLVGRG